MKSIDYIIKKNLIKIQAKRKINFKSLEPLFAGKNGLEVGGPSKIFRDGKNLPIYNIVNELDGCNFSNKTIWVGNIDSDKNYQYYENKTGVQYICEATDLKQIPDSKYDFIISSNCLEHVANPIKAVEEWIRVIKNEGIILLVLPNKEFCFDHNRLTTKFSHMLQDYQSNIQEDDLTHLDEILKMHDLKMDKLAGTFEQFKERSLKNFENRALHQHVFDMDVLKEIFVFFKLEIMFMYEGVEFVIIGKKTVDS
jgi:ubiquinone/menaquinone biosynthesis C-methylase UbiE